MDEQIIWEVYIRTHGAHTVSKCVAYYFNISQNLCWYIIAWNTNISLKTTIVNIIYNF